MLLLSLLSGFHSSVHSVNMIIVTTITRQMHAQTIKARGPPDDGAPTLGAAQGHKAHFQWDCFMEIVVLLSAIQSGSYTSKAALVSVSNAAVYPPAQTLLSCVTSAPESTRVAVRLIEVHSRLCRHLRIKRNTLYCLRAEFVHTQKKNTSGT